MKVYVINLDKNVERMENISSQLKRFGIECERISAVYGAALTDFEMRMSFSPFRSLCAQGYRLPAGAIGCALSHINVYRKMIEENVQRAVILEDDVVLSDDFCHVVEIACASVDVSRPQVVLLSKQKLEVESNPIRIIRDNNVLCTDGYVITLPAARLIRKANFPVVVTSDAWRRWRRRLGVELFRVNKPVVCQDNKKFGSDINGFLNRPDAVRRAIVRAKLKKPIRFFQVCIDYCIWLVCRK